MKNFIFIQLFYFCFIANLVIAQENLCDSINKVYSLIENNDKPELLVKIYFNSGIAKFNSKDYLGAIKDFEKTIQIDPKHGDGWYYLGSARYRIHDYINATIDFNKVIELNPGNAGAYNYRGDIKLNAGDFRSAIYDYSNAIELDSKCAIAYFNRGNAKHYINDHDGACHDWTIAGELGYNESYNLIQYYCKYLLSN